MVWHRKAVVAGRFYPGDRVALQKMLAGLCVDTHRVSVQALVVPHAGYIYSGWAAGQAYSKTQVPESVVILGPNHTGYGPPVSVWAQGSWETPLGTVEVDEPLALAFLSRLGAADQTAHEFEHSVEVHLPFLQSQRPGVRILPIVLGRLTLAQCHEVAKALASVAADTLWIASTDMSHFISRAQAQRLDRMALDAIEALDADRLYETVASNEISMCGVIPTTAVLAAARERNASRATVVAYTDSAQRTGDLSSVVAYAAVTIE